MSKLRLTYEQISYIVEKTGIENHMKAVEYFAELMIKEGISPTKMALCITKIMERERKQKK